MKKTLLAFLIYCLLLVSLTAYAQDPPNDTVALVGSLPITTYELERHANRIMPFNVSYHGTVTSEKKDEIKEKAFEELILVTQKANYAKDQGIEVPPEKVAAMLQRLKDKFETEAKIKEALGNETIEQLKAAFEKKLLAQAAEDHAVSSKITVTADDVKNYFNQNKDHYLHPKQFRASQIFVKVDPAATEDTRAELLTKAEGLLKKALAGEDFYNLAYYNSDDRTSFVGGDMGIFNQGQTAQPIDQALSNMDVGEISEIVETLAGYHILKLTQVIEPRQMSFEELEKNIRQYLITEKRDPLYAAWISKLQSSYKIKRYNIPKEQ